ncbi:virulence factor [Paenibacillus mucilaginosus]|uniref:Rhodopsin-like GPCR superfamily protein n=1 Tax=Paenibacillus mucilaginosus (strain KNP414) TaxID=1036673 RepID=F8FPW5_PAEMK|nr:virulence factor [Paenibacillus mucilaginosus]AEI39107.1 Rhodopsin-like GPCR superfamily protein [Paenibacillus mucilaginosus KNP414]MCG7216232.1 virulence factor [Paenibacillus mucilaginosus]WDM28130.1 conserved virulence factor C family protein [Paenibacillus mucilaginosus]
MPIVSIEPTPSPNTMKINMSESLPSGVRETYTREQAAEAPTPELQRLLSIEGVKAFYRAADFIAVDRMPKGEWGRILAEVREVLGVTESAHPQGSSHPAAEGPDAGNGEGTTADASFGEVHVFLQHFRGIPLQVRVSSGDEEQRAALPSRFSDTAVRAASASPNLIKERTLEEWDTRYGSLQEVLEDVVQELDAAYSDAQLEELAAQAAAGAGTGDAQQRAEKTRRELSYAEAEALLRSPEWKERYAALRRIQPSAETLPLLLIALDDEQAAVRRLASVYLGDLKDPVVLPHLYRALQDPSPSVRRTAGDTLSDLGDPAAQEAMIAALSDPNKLVRWRAARFLYELGDETALPALKAAEDEPEFEVRLQIRMALERIEGGEEAAGSVWQQMSRRDRS